MPTNAAGGLGEAGPQESLLKLCSLVHPRLDKLVCVSMNWGRGLHTGGAGGRGVLHLLFIWEKYLEDILLVRISEK